MSQEQSERRVADRAPLGAKVRWTVDNREWFEDDAQNVSSSGIMLRTSRYVEPGAKVRMVFKLPNLKFLDPITVEAEVARIVKRQEKQIGLGCRFLSLRSNNFVVVQEFVCRISGVRLDDAMKEIGDDTQVGYSFTMERLAREADRNRIQKIERKLAREEERNRQVRQRTWRERGLKVALFLVVVYLLFKIGGFLMHLLSFVKHGPL